MEDKELLTVPEFCRRYAISRTSLYREVSAGKLKLFKLGSHSRVMRQDADAWVSKLPIFKGEAA